MASNEIVALDPTSGPLDRKDPRAFPRGPRPSTAPSSALSPTGSARAKR